MRGGGGEEGREGAGVRPTRKPVLSILIGNEIKCCLPFLKSELDLYVNHCFTALC